MVYAGERSNPIEAFCRPTATNQCGDSSASVMSWLILLGGQRPMNSSSIGIRLRASEDETLSSQWHPVCRQCLSYYLLLLHTKCLLQQQQQYHCYYYSSVPLGCMPHGLPLPRALRPRGKGAKSPTPDSRPPSTVLPQLSPSPTPYPTNQYYPCIGKNRSRFREKAKK